MPTKKVKLYIQAKKYNWESEFNLCVDTMAFISDNNIVCVQLNSVEVDIEVPELDKKALTLAEIEQIRDHIKAEKANHYLRVTNLEDKINNLMCLENDTGVNNG